MTLPSIALVVPAYERPGGVARVSTFLYRAISGSGRFAVDLISIADSHCDLDSVGMLRPTTWLRGVRISEGTSGDLRFKHVGCYLAELEFTRYLPGQRLTHLLKQYDLVQVVAGAPAWTLAASRCGRPVCLQVATLVNVERLSLLRRARGVYRVWRLLMTRVTTMLEQMALRRVRTVFVENEWMKEHCRRAVPKSDVIFAPPGVDTSFFFSAEYQTDGYVLSVGRVGDIRKNVRLLLVAYARLRQLMPEAPPLVLAGASAPPSEDWAWATARGLDAYVQVHTGVSEDELRGLYRGASQFVLPADEEGLGLVILEAMACGLAVISTATAGAAVSISDGSTGILTPIGDPEAMALAMYRLAQDRELRFRLGHNGRQRVEEKFSFAVAARPFLEAYERLLGVSGSSAVGIPTFGRAGVGSDER